MKSVTPSAEPMTWKGSLYHSLNYLSLFKTVLAPFDMTSEDFSTESIVDVTTR
jgi:hypothetical protein